jgi:3-dehydroquinate synthase
VIEIQSGERSKSVDEWNRITDRLFKAGMRRNDTLLVVGGGVVGDLGGFVASTLFRGVRYLQLPTTLLAMVDSSIGGKVGINHSTGKNRIGAFYPPERIIVRFDFLKTLPKREWINGSAEMLKYGYIKEPILLEQLSALPDHLRLNSINQNEVPALSDSEWSKLMPLLAEWIQSSWTTKQDIVVEDEYEQGERMFLNYGHTFGHALEQFAGYGEIDHGVAVLAGMVCAGFISAGMNTSGAESIGSDITFQKSSAISLDPLRPFLELTEIDWQNLAKDPIVPQKLVQEMSSDKKNQSDQIRLILLESVGKPFIHETSDRNLLEQIWKSSLEWIISDPEKNEGS